MMTASQTTAPATGSHRSHPATASRHEAARLAAFAKAARHSVRVRRLKLVLPLTGATIILAFVGYSFYSIPSGARIDLGAMGFSDGKLVMANPKLEGFANNRPYTVTASRALQNPKTTYVIELEGIDAKVPVDADNWATIDAKSGVFDRLKNTLEITAPMTVTTTDGKKASFKSASVDIASGALTTKEPIDISMEGLSLTAQSMQVLKNGEIVVFNERVRMSIDPDRMKTALAQGEAPNAEN